MRYSGKSLDFFFILCLVQAGLAHAFEVAPLVREPRRARAFSASVQFRRYVLSDKITGPGKLSFFDGCSAVKISAYQFLTAAHCMTAFLSIYPGERQFLRSFAGDQRITIKLFENHPNFFKTSAIDHSFNENLDYDLAIVTVKEPTPKVSTVRLSLNRIGRGQTIYVGGYGFNANTQREGQLETDVRQVSGVQGHLFSFMSHQGGKFRSTIASGDSGGPVYAFNGSELVVVGINSNIVIYDHNWWQRKPAHTKTRSNFCGFSEPHIAAWLRANLR